VSTGNWVKHIVRPSNWNIGDWRRCNSSPIRLFRNEESVIDSNHKMWKNIG
jgi:hypothetical protein